MKLATLIAMLGLLGASGTPAADVEVTLAEPNAVLLNITEEHLNGILQSSARANGWTTVSGGKPRVSEGIYDLRYEAALSEPLIRLGDAGRARLSFDIREADLSIGRLERKVIRLPLRCEQLGLAVDPSRPVDVSVDFRFLVEDGGLYVHPEEVLIPHARKDFRLVKPRRCRHALLPKWLLWLVGKPRLRRQIDKLDTILLARAEKLAADLHGEGWDLGSDLYLRPQSLETGHGALFLALGLSGAQRGSAPPALASGTASRASESFVAVSESFLNTFLEHAMRGLHGGPRELGGVLTKVLRSDAIYALFPGLRELESTENVRFAVRLSEAPRLNLRAYDASGGEGPARSTALIAVQLSGIELQIRETEEQRELGTLVVDSATLGLVPFINASGGVSLEIVENEWSVSGRGIEQNEALIAATLQEVVFGETFETRYHPLVRDGVTIGDAAFQARRFDVMDGYLIIELARN